MIRKRWAAAISGIMLILAAIGISYMIMNGPSIGLAQGSDPNPTMVPQTMARRGDLTISAIGSGELAAVSSSGLSFESTGTVLEINVAAGDRVQAGDILARLKTDKTSAGIQAELAKAELAVVQAQQSRDQLVANAELETAQALYDLETSLVALDDLNHPEMKQAQAMLAVAAAEQAVATAQMNLYILQSMPSQEAIDIANASLLFKDKDYQELQNSIAKLDNQIRTAPTETARDRLEMQLIRTRIELAQQKIEVDHASYKISTLRDGPDPASVSLAEANLASAQAELDQAQRDLEIALTSPSLADLAEAELNVKVAQSTWERLQHGPDPVALAMAETQLAEAQAKLAFVQQEQPVLELKAPFSGTILNVNANPGDRIREAVLFTLGDLSQSMIEVSLDENDFTLVQTDMKAQVVFDALPEATFTGQVVRIDPNLQQSGNTYSAHAWVRLNQQDDRAAVELPLGVNANVEILIGKAVNAVLVPVEAIHRQDDGTAMVYVIRDDQLEQRLVTIGLMDMISAEITGGLQAGEIVATGTIEFSEGNP